MFKVLRKVETIKVGDTVAIDSSVYAGEKRVVVQSYPVGHRHILQVEGSPELFTLYADDVIPVWVK